MMSAVTIPKMMATFFVEDGAREILSASPSRGDCKVEEGVQIEVPPELYDWPSDEVEPEPATLCRSVIYPQQFKVFKRAADISEDQFVRTGMAYGRIYSRSHWERFVEELPKILHLYRDRDEDPPSVMDEAMRLIRAAD